MNQMTPQSGSPGLSIERLQQLVNQPQQWDFSGARRLYAGVDLGTYKAIAIVVDENGQPRAGTMRTANIVRSGMIVDYVGAVRIVKELMAELRARCPLPIEQGATSFPPQTESANLKTTTYILEAAELEVLCALDEPTAANQVLKIQNGAIVDVGGGTTGVAVIQDGRVVYTNDEATGGVHLSLVLAGAHKIAYEKAEAIKMDPGRAREVVVVVRPVIEKIAAIVSDYLQDFEGLERVCLVGGTVELAGFCQIIAANIGLETFLPPLPRFVTPFGIALSCLQPPDGSGHTAETTS